MQRIDYEKHSLRSTFIEAAFAIQGSLCGCHGCRLQCEMAEFAVQEPPSPAPSPTTPHSS